MRETWFWILSTQSEKSLLSFRPATIWQPSMIGLRKKGESSQCDDSLEEDYVLGKHTWIVSYLFWKVPKGLSRIKQIVLSDQWWKYYLLNILVNISMVNANCILLTLIKMALCMIATNFVHSKDSSTTNVLAWTSGCFATKSLVILDYLWKGESACWRMPQLWFGFTCAPHLHCLSPLFNLGNTMHWCSCQDY